MAYVTGNRSCVRRASSDFVSNDFNRIQGCARFGEFWLFFTEQVFTLPLYCYEKNNQGAQEFAHKSAK